ncbi:F420-dependent NADP reductase [Candidatus Gugararchaeum adminiculabundum]|nr:F420-dependent NADP reductase [Candidatus Gugararchaeum adminiculabundum]
MKIAIIGGSGEFGSFYAKLFQEAGFDVTITGRDQQKCKKVARENGVKCAGSNAEACADADVVIISVPIKETVSVAKEIAEIAPKDCLLMDFASVKVPVVKELKKAKCSEIAGCHPMHGPRISSLAGQSVIFVPVKKGGKYEKIVKFFADRGARIFETTAEENDKILGMVQLLTHYVYIATASTARALDIDVKKSRKFASPIYEMTIDMIARIIGQNPYLYAQIQMSNPYSREVHEAFIKEAQKLAKAVEENNEGEFVKIMKNAATHFGNFEDAMARSDKLIDALNEEIRELKGSVGSEVVLQNIYSGTVHEGRLASVDPEFVELEVGKKKSKIKSSNIRLLSGEKLREWKMNDAVSRDYSFVFEKCDAKEVVACAQNIDGENGDILQVKAIDEYALDGGKKSVTLRFWFYKNADVKGLERKVLARFAGIGAKQR